MKNGKQRCSIIKTRVQFLKTGKLRSDRLSFVRQGSSTCVMCFRRSTSSSSVTVADRRARKTHKNRCWPSPTGKISFQFIVIVINNTSLCPVTNVWAINSDIDFLSVSSAAGISPAYSCINVCVLTTRAGQSSRGYCRESRPPAPNDWADTPRCFVIVSRVIFVTPPDCVTETRNRV